MLINVKDIKKRKTKDSQKSDVYFFDNVISIYLLNNKIDYSKLYEGLSPDADILDLSKKIAHDFLLDNARFAISDELGTSYCRMSDVVYHSSHANSEDFIEVMFHEISHLFSHLIFNKYGEAHDGHFIAIFRMLLNHYDIIKTEKFNELVAEYCPRLKVYDNYISGYRLVTTEEFDNVESKTTFMVKTSEMHTKIKINNKDKFDYYLKNKLTNKCMVFSRTKFGYEIQSSFFENKTLEELVNMVIVSPVTKIDEGEKTVSRIYYDDGFFTLKLEDSDRFTTPVKLVEENYEIFTNKREAQESLSSYVKEERSRGQKVLRVYSWNDFCNIKIELNKAVDLLLPENNNRIFSY